MDSVPVRVRGDKASRMTTDDAAPSENKGKRRAPLRFSKRLMIVAAIIILAAGTAAAWYFVSSRQGDVIDQSKYQAVFFTNGQVYFGKLEKLDENYMRLTHVFYLQTPNSSSTPSSQNPQDANKSSQLQLTKLGTEIHSPEDTMVISKSQMLFFENLKDDGKVVQGIGTYYKEQQNK